MGESKHQNKIIFLSAIISLLISIFYFFYVNLPTDSLILFLPNKIFLGEWLKKGIVPFYNPYIFLGIPFLFDIGLGNLHPFNILFIFPYPLSLSLWIFATVFIFSFGFLNLFYSLNKNLKWSFLFFLIILFSGQGIFIRMNNPTIWAVISHWGIYLYTLKNIKKNRYGLVIFWAVMMALAGHFQMVVFGFLLGFLFAILIYTIQLKKLLKLHFLILIVIFPYLLFSTPLVFESTRINLSSEYSKSASLSPFHLIQIFLPLIFGNIKEGAQWFVNQTEVIISSILISFFLFILAYRRKLNKFFIIGLISLLIISFGLIYIPFLRNLQQIYAIIFFLIMGKVAREEKIINRFFQNLANNKMIVLLLLLISFIVISIFIFFDRFFITLLMLLKRYPHPFYDLPTISAIKLLLVKSIFLYILFLFLLIVFKKKILIGLLFFVLIEGLILNYFHNFFVSQRIIVDYAFKKPFIKEIDNDKKEFRIQSVLDVYPYTGIHSYIPGILKRPPFSKEKDFFENEKNTDFPFLKNNLLAMEANWNIVFNLKSIQGYATFVPKNISSYFSHPSYDYKEKYAHILAKNPFLGGEDKGCHINYIESSRITFSDQRWENLGIKYIVSPFPLNNYYNLKLYNIISGFYLYQTKNPKPIYSAFIGKKTIIPKVIYQDPNTTRLSFPNKLPNTAKFVIIEQAGGKIIKVNGNKLKKYPQGFYFYVYLPKNTSIIEIYYSPIQHLYEQLLKYFSNFYPRQVSTN